MLCKILCILLLAWLAFPVRRRRKNQLDAVSDWSSAPPATIPTHSPGDPNTSLQHPISGEDVSNSTHDQSGAL